MTGAKKGVQITDLGWRPDTDPRYSRGWTILSGKFLNPNFRNKSKPTDADDQTSDEEAFKKHNER